MSKFVSGATRLRLPAWEPLEKPDIERLHAATVELLETTGVRVLSARALDLLKPAGCAVDSDGTVRIPERLIRAALDSVPRQIEVFGRDGDPAMTLRDGVSYFGGGSDTVARLDHITCERCPTSLDSVREFVRVMDALPGYDFVMSMGTAFEIEPELRDSAHFLAMLQNTCKPILFTAQTGEAMARIARMCEAFRGGIEQFRASPMCVLYAMPTAPLIHTGEALEGLITASEMGMPVIYGSAPMKGATGPITTAGTLLLSNAEILSGMVIHQLAHSGSPFVYAATLGPLELRTMVNIYNGPECMHMQAASTQLGRFYGLPTFATAGCSDSKAFDQQAAAECALSLNTAVIAGASVVHDVGYLESGLCSSLQMCVLADELIGKLRFLARGINIGPGDLLVGDIIKAGIGGEYLTFDSTAERHLDEIWYPSLFSHQSHDQWQASGSADTAERIGAKLSEILAAPPIDPLPPDLLRSLEEIAYKKN